MTQLKRFIMSLAVILLMLSWPGTAQARTPGVTVVGPADSIQAAVDAASPGDTIIVFGTHRENVAIVKDGLTLRGIRARILPPVTPTAHACFDPTQPAEAVHGICVSGDVDLDTGQVIRYVKDVTVAGFTIRNFTGSGITVSAARRVTITGNVTVNNVEAGVSTTAAPGARLLFNSASGTDRAAFFVFRSPNVTLLGNIAKDSRYGIQIGDSLRGSLVANSIHDNCLGILLIADSPGPVGGFRIAANRVQGNTRACPANENDPALSGAGLVLFGARNTTIVSNLITGNVPAGPTALSGGIALIEGPGGTPPAGNVVTRNLILGNDPDIFWDQSGTGNIFRLNHCRLSTPLGLCR